MELVIVKNKYKINRSAPADSSPGPRCPFARGGRGLVVACRQDRGGVRIRGARGARKGPEGAAVGKQQVRVSGCRIVTPALMDLCIKRLFYDFAFGKCSVWTEMGSKKPYC